MGQTGGPTLLGVDVIWVATILSGIAAFAVMVAIYAATTVRDFGSPDTAIGSPRNPGRLCCSHEAKNESMSR